MCRHCIDSVRDYIRPARSCMDVRMYAISKTHTQLLTHSCVRSLTHVVSASVSCGLINNLVSFLLWLRAYRTLALLPSFALPLQLALSLSLSRCVFVSHVDGPKVELIKQLQNANNQSQARTIQSSHCHMLNVYLYLKRGTSTAV